MSLPEVGHKCTDCANFVPDMQRDIKRPCVYQKRIVVDRFCVDFEPKVKP